VIKNYKNYVLALAFLVSAFPSGLLAGAVFTDGTDYLLQAVLKLIDKVKALEKRVSALEREVSKLSKGDQKIEVEGITYGPVYPKYVVIAEKLRLRECPSMRCKVKTLLSRGEVVEKIDSYKAWFKVKSSGGEEGWVYSKFLVPY